MFDNDLECKVGVDSGGGFFKICLNIVTRRLVGQGAANQAVRNPENTIFHVKRLIGRDDVKSRFGWLNTLLPGSSGIKIKVKHNNKDETYTPTEISSLILNKMKDTAEQYFRTIKDAVITVPAYFNDNQRRETLKR